MCESLREVNLISCYIIQLLLLKIPPLVSLKLVKGSLRTGSRPWLTTALMSLPCYTIPRYFWDFCKLHILFTIWSKDVVFTATLHTKLYLICTLCKIFEHKTNQKVKCSWHRNNRIPNLWRNLAIVPLVTARCSA